jgi:hypothetical protein
MYYHVFQRQAGEVRLVSHMQESDYEKPDCATILGT